MSSGATVPAPVTSKTVAVLCASVQHTMRFRAWISAMLPFTSRSRRKWRMDSNSVTHGGAEKRTLFRFQRGIAGSAFGFRETALDSLDLVTEWMRVKKGAIGQANQLAYAVRMGQPLAGRCWSTDLYIRV